MKYLLGARQLPNRRIVLLAIVIFILVAVGLSLTTIHFLNVCETWSGWSCKPRSPDKGRFAEPAATERLYETPDRGPSAWEAHRDEVLRVLNGSAPWEYARDAHNMSISREKCGAAFPMLDWEIARASQRYGASHIELHHLDKVEMTDGRVRASIRDGQLYVIQANITIETQPQALAVLKSLFRAISHVPPGEKIPDIEFIFSVRRQETIEAPVWTFDREKDQSWAWLMPNVGPRPPAGFANGTVNGFNGDIRTLLALHPYSFMSTEELVQRVEELELSMPFTKKTPELVGGWRTTGIQDLNLRQRELIRATSEMPWIAQDAASPKPSDQIVGFDRSKALPGPNQAKSAFAAADTLTSICRFALIAHDSTFNIPLSEVPLLCESVVITTRPRWVEIYHPLMRVNRANFDGYEREHPVVADWAFNGGGDQNAVVVSNDFGDLTFKVEGLLKNTAAAEKIARNNVETFRLRYLTDAATACYWRELVYRYSEVSFKPAGVISSPLRRRWMRGSGGS